MTPILTHTIQKRTKGLRAKNTVSSEESVNTPRQEIARPSGDLDRENTEPEEEPVGTQLKHERSIRTAASTGPEIETEQTSTPVGASGKDQPGDIGTYVEIFDAFSPLTQPAKILDFDGSTYTLQHGLSGGTLKGIPPRVVHPLTIYEAGSKMMCYNKKGKELSLACKQCTVASHSQEEDGEINYTVDCLNHDDFRVKMLFPLTNLQRILNEEALPWISRRPSPGAQATQTLASRVL